MGVIFDLIYQEINLCISGDFILVKILYIYPRYLQHTHITLILLVLILILILAVDEAVGEDAAEQQRDRGDVDGDVIDGHLHFIGEIQLSFFLETFCPSGVSFSANNSRLVS